jgi:hypothetical protein
MLFTQSSKPVVSVTVNGILAQCPNENCNYEVDADITPTISAYTISGNTMTLTLSNPSNVFSYTQSDAVVELGPSSCAITSFSATSIACTLDTLVAGTYKPSLHIAKLGFAILADGLADHEVPLTITSFTPSSGSQKGGITVTVTGTGFPSSADAGFVAKLQDTAVTVLSLTSTTFTFTAPVAPASGDLYIKAEFNGKSAQSSS